MKKNENLLCINDELTTFKSLRQVNGKSYGAVYFKCNPMTKNNIGTHGKRKKIRKEPVCSQLTFKSVGIIVIISHPLFPLFTI